MASRQCFSMSTLVLVSVFGCLTFAPSTTAAADMAQSNAQPASSILVGANMLVSRDGDFPHMELAAAANPRNPKNLVGGAITAARGEGGFACRTYASTDGGSTWTAAEFPEQLEFGGADPAVGFGLHGTAYFSALAFVKDDNGNVRGGLFFYRSEDGGKTWQKPANLGYSYDHEVMTVDHSFGRYAGRVYLSVLYGKYPEYTLGIFRSDDDGRTFTGPVDAASGKGIIGINTMGNIEVLSDGTLVLPYGDFEFDPAKRKDSHTSNMWVVTSSDGGVTFSQPVKIGVQTYDKDLKGPGFQTFGSSAVDHSDVFQDRLYTAWTDYRTGAYRLLFTYSKDRGKTWTATKRIGNDAPDWASQYQPTIAVNRDGTVGVTWFDTRHSAKHDDKQYDQYFAASVDGGESFAAPARVSDATSSRFGKGNLTMQASAWSSALYNGEETRVSFLSAVSRWPAGGDYMGLAVDRDGIFHPFWADARTGTYQIQTARVSVTKAAETGKTGLKSTATVEAPTEKPAPARTRINSSLYGKIELVFDPTSYDPTTDVLDVPTRLRNISPGPIYGPISLEVLKFGSGLDDELKEYAPAILNATNKKDGNGAVFDYSSALDTEQVLAPGALSGQVVWHLKVQDPLRIPDLHVALKGMVPEIK
jgi:hypothetical protein